MPELVCFSLHHRSLPYSQFKKYMFSDYNAFYKDTEGLERVLIQSTTRIEVYAVGKHEKLRDLFPEEVKIYKDKKAVEHLFRLIGSIESRVLGENYLHLLIKEDFHLAKKLGAVADVLSRVFKSSFRVSERVEKDTIIRDTSILSSIAIKKITGKITPTSVVIFGAGRCGMNVVKELKESKRDIELTIVNRQPKISKIVQRQVGGKVAEYENLKNVIRHADVLICATLASHYRVNPELLLDAGKIYVLDLSPFRNVDPSIAKLPNVEIINGEIDKAMVEHMKKMKREVPKVEKIIEEELRDLYAGSDV